MMKLNKRLKIIAELVDERVVADVGCDHGKIVLNLFQQNKIDSAVISDISAPSLQKAIDLLNVNGNFNFKSYVCDGLRDFKDSDNIKQIIISGMGGLEIMQILSNSPIELKSLILQPQRNEIDVKKFLIDNNFNIVYDVIIEDKDKFYNIIKAIKKETKQCLSEFDLLFGKINFLNLTADFKNYLNYLYDKNSNLYNKLTDTIKKQEILDMLNQIKRAKSLLGESNE